MGMKPHTRNGLRLTVAAIIIGALFMLLGSGCARYATDRGIVREAYARRLLVDSVRTQVIVRPGATGSISLRPEIRWPIIQPGRVDTIDTGRVRIIVRYIPGKPIQVQAQCPPDSTRTIYTTRTVRVPYAWHTGWWWALIGAGLMLGGLIGVGKFVRG